MFPGTSPKPSVSGVCRMTIRPRSLPQVNESRSTDGNGSPDRLESWKEIAVHLNRTVRTVQRWEKLEGLPIHRHQHEERSSIYAFKPEIDAWWNSRRVRLEEVAGTAGTVDGAGRKLLAATGDSLYRILRFAAILALPAIAALLLLLKPWQSRRDVRFQSRLDGAEIAKVTGSGRVEDVAISRDGRFIVYEERERGGIGLRLRQLATEGDVQILAPEAVRFDGLSFSPDGDYVYFVRADSDDPGFKHLYAMPRTGGQTRRVLSDIDSPVAFSPDGRQFVYTRAIPRRNATEVRIADGENKANRLLTTVTDTYAFFQPGATWSPDGRTVAVSLHRLREIPAYALYSIRVADGSVSEIFSSPSPIGRPCWRPGGRGFLLELRAAQGQGKGQVWTVSFPEGHRQRLTNDLSDFNLRADLTRDGSLLAGVDGTAVFNVWEVNARQPSEASQITSLNLPLVNVVESNHGKLLAVNDGRLSSFTEDGKQGETFSDLGIVGAPAVCGRFVVVNSYRNGTAEMTRVDADGSDPMKLISGALGAPACARDGDYAFYYEMGPPPRILRIPIQGGEPAEVAKVLGDTAIGRISVSPDGKALAYHFEEHATHKIKLAIVPSTGGPALRTMDAPGGIFATSTQWSADGTDIQYILTKDGVSNVWEQPLDGSQPRQLTQFSSSQIYGLSWSADRKHLLLTRGEDASDAVLLKNLP